jgi:hypothetical protein
LPFCSLVLGSLLSCFLSVSPLYFYFSSPSLSTGFFHFGSLFLLL